MSRAVLPAEHTRSLASVDSLAPHVEKRAESDNNVGTGRRMSPAINLPEKTSRLRDVVRRKTTP